MRQISYNQTATLYLIPTPIGNLDDITIRSLNLLREVDLVLCEDTRVTRQLLKKYDISKKLVSCHEYNEEKVKEYVVSLLASGKNLGLVTDQGSPIISDPGYVIVKYVISCGYNVVGLPGATAFVPAFIASGFGSNHFLYYGFLNPKNNKQKQELDSLKNYPFPIIFYEAPHRILNTLENILTIFGDRQISISREISKIHEEIIRGKISECMQELNIIKGEFVIVIEGASFDINYEELSIVDHVVLYMEDGINEMDAIKKVAKERGIAKSIDL